MAAPSGHSNARRMVPATEYDALIDILRVVIDDTMSTTDAVSLALDELGADAARLVGAILIDNATSREIFAEAAT